MDGAKGAIDAYIERFPKEVQGILQELRKVIREEVPEEVEETISYGVPTFKLNGKYVVYFAAFKHHISIYPVFSTMQESLPEIAVYQKGRGTLQFSLDKPLPFPFIRNVVRLLVQENLKRMKN